MTKSFSQMRAVPLALLASFAADSTLLAQSNAQSDQLRELNARVLQFGAVAQTAGISAQSVAAAQATTLFDERLAALSALIERDPRQALLVAFPPDLIERIAGAAPELRSRLEAHGAWQGQVEYIVQDGVNFATSESIVRMRTGGRTAYLHFAGPQPAFHSGDTLTVRGLQAGDRIAVEEAQVAPAAAACLTTGPQNIVVILVNLKSYPLPTSMTRNFITGVMFGNAGGGDQSATDLSVDDFWRQNSDGQLWVNRSGPGGLKIVGPYNLPADYNTDNNCDYFAMVEAAWAAADGDVDYNDFSRTVVVAPNNGACSQWAGLATVGCFSSTCPGDGACNYSWSWQRADQMASRSAGVHLTTHEVGHNLTLRHSNTRTFGGETLGPLGVMGDVTEYGDSFATMGDWNLGFYNADHAIQQLGWLKPGLNYLDVSTSGAYSLPWYGTQPAGLKALRIRRGAPADNATLVVEFIRKQGIYNTNHFDSALVHYRDSYTGGYTHLLDFKPATANRMDSPLMAGQTWTDPYTNLSLRVDGIVNGMLNLTVTYGATPCTRAAPAVTMTPSNPSTQAGNPVSYTVTVKNNDSAGCAAASFDLSSSVPNGWPAGSFSPASLTIDPGASLSATLTKTPPAGTGVGTYSVNAIATSGASGMKGTGTAGCTVVLPPAPGTPSAPSPSNGATGIALAPTLSWTGGSGATSHDVYFGTATSPPLAQNVTGTSYAPGALAAGQRYYWKVVARNAGGTKTSAVWSFTTQAAPQLPAKPGNPTPASGAKGQATSVTLRWSAASGAMSYDVHFGVASPPPPLGNTTATNYQVENLSKGTTYYWRVVARNGVGTTNSNIWSFTTAAPVARLAKAGVFLNGEWYLDVNANGVWEPASDRRASFGWAGTMPVLGDWNGDGKTQIGVFLDGAWYLDYNGNGAWNGTTTDRAYGFGWPGVTAVVGDWNGDGKTKVGVFKDGWWHLDMNGNGVWEANVDRASMFGWPGVTPVVGDWNGDGKTQIGVFHEGAWYLDYNGNGNWDGTGSDRAYGFGWAGVTAVVGDWSGDGKTKVGVFKDGWWYLDMNGNGAWEAGVDRQSLFGWAGVTAVVGDWNANGKTKVGVFHEGAWYLDLNGNGVWNGSGTDRSFGFGWPGVAPVTGNW
ncbi:MAG: hypothetical protein KIT09_18000 [Bryobacteraceae bacterium]|nr:hypothetical protein [Bryobacteraceae bacterium]